jgi:hypothetical protein
LTALSKKGAVMQIDELLAQMGGLQSVARELGVTHLRHFEPPRPS